MCDDADATAERESALDRDDEREHTVQRTRRPSAPRARNADQETREVLCADQVAAWLGVDRKSVYNAAARGTLPYQRLGKRLLFSRSALAHWVSQNSQARATKATP